MANPMDDFPPDTAGTLEQFWHTLAAWSQETFGGDGERGPVGPLKHLQKEAKEAEIAAGDVAMGSPIGGNDLADLHTEIADCLFLVFDAARRSGLSYSRLVETVWRKMAVNRQRRWGPKSADGVTEHVRG